MGMGATAALVVGVLMMGATGTCVSMVKVREGLTPDGLSARSVARAVTVTEPGRSADEVHAHMPDGGTTVLHSSTPPRLTRTVLPGSPVPMKVGVVVLLKLASAGDATTGVAGSTVSFRVLRVSVPVPVTLVCDAVSTMAGPSASDVALTEVLKRPAEQLVVVCTVPTRTVTVPAAVVICVVAA
jgi:hypothetical protein